MARSIARSAEARKVLRQWNAELASVGGALGEPLVWSAAEAELLELIASTIDRKCYLTTDYGKADSAGQRIALSGELRLVESQLARLLKQVYTDVPVGKPSAPTMKARKAANARWDRERARAANS
jgi:hypothetical protein